MVHGVLLLVIVRILELPHGGHGLADYLGINLNLMILDRLAARAASGRTLIFSLLCLALLGCTAAFGLGLCCASF